MIKRLCRWILKRELEEAKNSLAGQRELSKSLAIRLKPHMPELKSDGSCQSDTLSFQMDVCRALDEPLHMPVGTFTVNSNITLKGATMRMGRGSSISPGPSTTMELKGDLVDE